MATPTSLSTRMLLEQSLATSAAEDGEATLVGRVWDPEARGPSPVLVRNDEAFDLSEAYPTIRDLCEEAKPAEAARAAARRSLGSWSAILGSTLAGDLGRPRVLAPVDLQTLKAAGVTFVASMLERLIEERVRGDSQAATRMRAQIVSEIGTDLGRVVPGSAEARRVKEYLSERGLWSQYLEVGIGPDAEIFTKAPTLAAVGTLASIGVPSSSTWNNPEPEVALVISSSGRVVGATLANDVNLRDIEGRSALLLPQAKDNNASCALGPVIRLFDDSFSLDAVLSMTIELDVLGEDGFALHASSPMSQISRHPDELVRQLFRSHQYPDGAVLMLGTPFAPTTDRDQEGKGFTHHYGDFVKISAPEIGGLVNDVQPSEECLPWTFGIRELMTNLSARNLLESRVRT